MKLTSMKISFLSLAIIAIASVTGCTNTNNPNQNISSPSVDAVSNTDHSTMNHDMDMDLGTADANYDLRFIDAMAMHHQSAVVMAREAQEKSKRPEIKQLASNIIKAQKKEIAQMQQWRQAWYPQASEQPVAYGGANKSVVPMSAKQHETMMMSEDLGAADAQFDLRFINAMIPHHEGAVTMAKDALNKSNRPEIKQLAQEIIASQQTEVKQMQQWRKAWYNQ
ncbi:DUF305 domain-containing protein [Aliterella atlantica]|uniref:DUF305 domain-containing protein n=1 Tax=Aliterella atlantica CENA595 TaxID=1618023 RepID=A0A0D8ZR38_9CYAN|nr:DUF305 domain-containing protein [Aliterella atlantica]KJH71268.1 hypothetical protein UH38_13345 [Aliterella atlantica CENA595]